MAKNVKLDHSGMAALLKSAEVRSAVNTAAERMAASVRSAGIRVGDRDGGPDEYDLPVTVEHATTDRAKAFVTLAHPSGQAVESKHRLLGRAIDAGRI